MLFSDLIHSLSRSNDGVWHINIPESWMQGRTTYGGLSSAICLQTINNDYPDLPPLRSAQINFIGPAGGDIFIKSTVLRQGKSVAYISAEMFDEKGIATHAVFCFGAKRESRINKHFLETPGIPSPEESDDFFKFGPGPVFTQNFECLLASGDLPVSGSEDAEFYIWARHKDHTANNIAALLSIADMPPPAALAMFKQLAPISSMTWMVNFLSDDPQTDHGWWLLNSKAEHAKDGYTSQNMKVWNRSGELVITGRQNVAIFY